MKNSIKRAQSQAGLSFAERLRVLAGASEQVLGRAKRQSRARAGEPCSGMRENRRSLAGGESIFRPQVKNKLLLLLVLLMTAATVTA